MLLSALFLGDKPSLPVVLTLLPIIGGVVLASTAELSFTWKGFLSGEPRRSFASRFGAGGSHPHHVDTPLQPVTDISVPLHLAPSNLSCVRARRPRLQPWAAT